MRCVFCNEAIHPQDRACPTCGYPTASPEEEGVDPARPERRWRALAAVAGGCGLLALVGGYVAGRLTAPPSSAAAAGSAGSPRLAPTQVAPPAVPALVVAPAPPAGAPPTSPAVASSPAVARVLRQPPMPETPFDRNGDGWADPLEPMPAARPASPPPAVPPAHLLVTDTLAVRGAPGAVTSVTRLATVPGMEVTVEIVRGR